MTLFKWVIKSLVHYRRMHIAVALAAAVATATLTGALLVGDSVRATLKYAFDTRLGNAGWVISDREGFLTEGLARRLKNEDIDAAPVLRLRGMVTKGDGSVRVNRVNVLGVDKSFFKISLAGGSPAGFENGKVLINSALAYRLKIKKDSNAEVVLRFDNPSAISRNLVLAPFKDSTIAARLPVAGVVDDDHFGRFSLEANQQEPLNLFVPIGWLQKQIKRNGKANLLLINDPLQKITKDQLNRALGKEWRLEDAGVELKTKGKNTIELKSSRVFLDRSFGIAAKKIQPDALRILTYFVNTLQVGDASTPYSMVTAVDRKGPFTNVLPPDMKDSEIVINQWLADDLNAKFGDELTLKYFVPNGLPTLQEDQRTYMVCRVIPLEGAAADPDLMPDLPGITDSKNCRDWDPSLPINLDRIRDKDEAYWDKYRGTPKAFITITEGQSMWANAYGDLTAIRFQGSAADLNSLAENLRRLIDPASLGLSIIPVHEIGLRASRGGTDFGQLFLGLSMFLIVSGILLTWLLFVFSIEGRKAQTGMLIAIGFPVKKIRKLYLYEGLFIALIGAFAGVFISLIYTWLLVWVLSTAWQGALAGMTVRYSASIMSIVTGFVSGFIIAFIAMVWSLHRQVKTGAHGLLSGNETFSINNTSSTYRIKLGWISSTLSFAGALLLLIFTRSLVGSSMAAAFFGAGTLLLIAFMTWVGMLLGWMGKKYQGSLRSLSSLALCNTARRKGRSIAVIVMLACGVFMVVAVGANRKDPGAGADRRTSGTGGFELYAESSVPVVQNLNTIRGQRAWGLVPSMLNGTEFINLQVRDGDDASCLNLNRAQEPRILGVPVSRLTELGAFSFQEIADSTYKAWPWDLLKKDLGVGIIPAIGDYPTVYWGLGKKIGDTVIYHNRKGDEITLKIVGMMKSSILQGSLIISSDNMTRYFPEVEGYRAWLIDTPLGKKDEIARHLTTRMADAGLSVEKSVDRLELFGRVEETYLSIFLVLGGLGLMLGCVGLGLIVARNLIERQGELAMLRAVGFSHRAIFKMVCYEHIFLLAAGMFAGFLCAIVSVMPSIRAAAGQVPFGLLAVMMLLIGVSGILWVIISTGISMRGDILTPLRNE